MFKMEMIGIAFFIFLVMTGLGTTLTVAQFREVWRRPYPLFIGFLSQFVVMPATAFGVAYALGFGEEMALSVVLLGASPGGVNSNLFTYYSRSNLCLSVCMTVSSTFICVVSIPLILMAYSALWGARALEIPYGKVMMSTVMVVLPVLLGMVIRAKRPLWAPKLERVSSVAGVVFLLGIIGFSLVKHQDTLKASTGDVFLAGFLVSFCGFLFGYGVSRLGRLREADARAVSFETGLQNVSLTIAIIAFSFPEEVQMQMAIIPGVYMIFVLPLAMLICRIFRGIPLGEEFAAEGG